MNELNLVSYFAGMTSGFVIMLVYFLTQWIKSQKQDKKQCDCDCHMFIGGSGKACPDCIKSKCSYLQDSLHKEKK
jgi:hypothetical protein